jgi:hypothetical protein
LVESNDLLIAFSLCHQNGRMECWNIGILRERAEINHFNCKKTPFLQLGSGQAHPSFHYSIIPLSQL